MIRRTLLAALLIALLPFSALSLPEHPVVLKGLGYRTWMAPADAKAWQMERLLYELRQKDEGLRARALEQLGFERTRVDRTLMWRAWSEPIKVEQSWLGFERRTLAVLTAPYQGGLQNVLVIFTRDGNDQQYWKPWQIFEFDTDPAQGLQVSYPDILSEGIHQLAVRHQVKDDIYGNREVVTIFKDDERGGERQMLPVWQETVEAFRSGKFEGDPQWMSATLAYGDQHITRKVTSKHYDYTLRAEDVRYLEAPYDKPKRVDHYTERFSYNPADFSFYDSLTELEKLVRAKSPELRVQAARRLGSLLSTTHPQLEKAMLKDKDARVRIEAALALATIADPAALASVRKGLANTEEDDTVKEALERAEAVLEPLAAALPTPEPAAAPKAKAKAKKSPRRLPPIQAEDSPKLNPRE
jgi:hypothetical protein